MLGRVLYFCSSLVLKPSTKALGEDPAFRWRERPGNTTETSEFQG